LCLATQETCVCAGKKCLERVNFLRSAIEVFGGVQTEMGERQSQVGRVDAQLVEIVGRKPQPDSCDVGAPPALALTASGGELNYRRLPTSEGATTSQFGS
jgi:hypothetical protein